jgi:hypothetical protein
VDQSDRDFRTGPELREVQAELIRSKVGEKRADQGQVENVRPQILLSVLQKAAE